MFRPNTLLVIGAGASNEVGFPLGGELVREISTLLRFERSDFSSDSVGGNADIRRAIKIHGGPSRMGQLLDLCREMSFALEHADSIDAYLNDFRGNDDLKFCGKIAIAYAIAKAEAKSPLAPDKSNIFNTLNWSTLANSWYSKFFRILKEDVGVENIDEIFDDISIICFNYDRSIEQYLFYALRHYYRIKPQQAIELLQKLKIIRPYGSLGGFSYDLNTGHSNYAGELNGAGLIEQAKLLKTVYENREDASGVSETRIEIEYAEQIVFLGFGFHPLNIDLLKANNVIKDLRVFATGWNLPGPAKDIFLTRIASIFHKENSRGEGLLREGRVKLMSMMSKDLLDQFGLVMSRA